jgi:malonyl-CoA/methylmalonyl-CoA synthetase
VSGLLDRDGGLRAPRSAFLDRFAQARGTAIIDAHGEHGYDVLRSRASRVAACVGDGRGRRVAILASPGADFASALFGVVSSGACAVVLSPLHPAAESRFFCDDADVDLLFVTADQQERARTFAGERRIVSLDDVASGVARDTAASGDMPALMLYTSGTTGKPKGAVLTHGNLSMQQELLGEAWGLGANDVLVHALPLHHMHGLCIALLSCLGAGAAVRTLPAFDAAGVFDAMGHGTVFMAVPTMYKKLTEAFDAADPDVRARWTHNATALRLATSGSAALPATLAERWRAITGQVPLERFGMTEIGVGLSNPLHGERRTGTVGLPLRTVETRVDEATGELRVRGPSVFREYFRRDDATARAFDGQGWFLTGDTVTRDDRGYFRILGRTSVDILKSGGYKLSALEIEEALRDHDAVSDVAVVGLPDETWGDRVVACVVVRPGKELDPATLRAFAKERLASYKCPKDVIMLEELPRNAMGKVQKPALVTWLLERAQT